MRAKVILLLRQAALIVAAALAYFGVRGLTEGRVDHADSNAARVLRVERALGIDLESRMQDLVLDHDHWVTLANWIYIWLHWPVISATLLWLLLAHQDDYYRLRNAMFISGAIGLVIFATFPVTPPRLYGLEYLDTVTERSNSYRVLQPPALVNKYAAVPSLHFGWNLIVGVTWWQVGRGRAWKVAAVAMPVAMGWAVIVTANHWVVDVIVGGAVALAGLAIEHVWGIRRRAARLARAVRRTEAAATPATTDDHPHRRSADEPDDRLRPSVGDPPARPVRGGSERDEGRASTSTAPPDT